MALRHASLRFILVARGAASVAFVAWVSATSSTFAELLVPFMWFAGVDGVLSLLMAMLVIGIPLMRRGFAMIAALDGVWLVAAALTLHFGPGVPDFGLTLVLYLSVAAVCAFFVGVLKVSGARNLHKRVGRDALSASLLIAGVATGVRLLIGRVDAWTGRSLLTVGVLHSSFNATETLLHPAYDWVRVALTIAVGVLVIAFGSRSVGGPASAPGAGGR